MNTNNSYKFTYLSPVKSINSFHKKVKAKNLEWLKSFASFSDNDDKLLEMVDKTDTAGWISWIYPEADQELLQLWIDHVVWLFIYDDVLEESETKEKFNYFCDELINIIKRKPRNLSDNVRINNFFNCWVDVVDRMYSRDDTDQFRIERFIYYFEHYLEGCKKEKAFLGNKQIPTVKEYVDYRYGCVGLLNYLLGTEFMKKATNKTVNHPKIQRLLEITVLHVTWVNDLYSLKRENEQGLPNLVPVIQKERKISKEQAIGVVLKEIEDFTAEFKSIYSEIKKENNQNLNDYCEGMIEFMIGNVEWSRKAGRYNSETKELIEHIEIIDKLY